PTAANVSAGNFHRLLEFVHVPSRFSGTEDFLIGPPPAAGVAGNNLFEAPLSPHNANLPDLAPFYVPFNRVSRFRDPGRINLNTLADQDVQINGANPYF